jgi:hypothetical protein
LGLLLFHLGVVFLAHCTVGFPHPSQAKVGHSMTSLVLNVGYYFHNMAWCDIKGTIKHFMIFQQAMPLTLWFPLSKVDFIPAYMGLSFGFGPL